MPPAASELSTALTKIAIGLSTRAATGGGNTALQPAGRQLTGSDKSVTLTCKRNGPACQHLGAHYFAS